jgi:hypothetical protein
MARNKIIRFLENLTNPASYTYPNPQAALGPDGDADGDGFTNRQEFEALGDFGGDLHAASAAYVAAVLDPASVPQGEGELRGRRDHPAFGRDAAEEAMYSRGLVHDEPLPGRAGQFRQRTVPGFC